MKKTKFVRLADMDIWVGRREEFVGSGMAVEYNKTPKTAFEKLRSIIVG